jgi:hypothetical protein
VRKNADQEEREEMAHPVKDDHHRARESVFFLHLLGIKIGYKHTYNKDAKRHRAKKMQELNVGGIMVFTFRLKFVDEVEDHKGINRETIPQGQVFASLLENFFNYHISFDLSETIQTRQ